ncbi:SLAC1 anion channel family protein [Nocardioides baekrokdamisoli]|nr:SLAC1 anion channel family protein [Nocardioides baekrokdamisoli]
MNKERLSWLPVALFGAVMGLSGLSLAWRLAHEHFGTPSLVADGIGWLALTAYIAQIVGYGIKAITGFGHVKAEFRHPVTGALFGTPLISTLLVPALLAPYNLTLAHTVWWIGAAGMVALAWHMASRWMGITQQRHHATPAWIVPLVGLLDIPLAVPALKFSHEPRAVMMFGLSVGLFFAIPLFTIIFARLMFEEPLPAGGSPVLMVLLAPFSVGFSAYVITIGRVDDLAKGLLAIAGFLLLVLLGRLRHLAKCCPFRVAWWTVSFPLAATAGAALRYATLAPSTLADTAAVAMLTLATVVIAGLLARTLHGIARGELQALAG